MSDDGKGNYGREEGMDYSGAFESDVKEEQHPWHNRAGYKDGDPFP